MWNLWRNNKPIMSRKIASFGGNLRRRCGCVITSLEVTIVKITATRDKILDIDLPAANCRQKSF